MTDANLNVAVCLKEASYVGYDRIHNLCSGTITDVPWGTLQWVGLFGGILFGVFMTVLALMLLIMITRAVLDPNW